MEMANEASSSVVKGKGGHREGKGQGSSPRKKKNGNGQIILIHCTEDDSLSLIRFSSH